MGIFQRGKFFGRWEFSKGAIFLVDGNFPKGQFFGTWEFSKGTCYFFYAVTADVVKNLLEIKRNIVAVGESATNIKKDIDSH